MAICRGGRWADRGRANQAKPATRRSRRHHKVCTTSGKEPQAGTAWANRGPIVWALALAGVVGVGLSLLLLLLLWGLVAVRVEMSTCNHRCRRRRRCRLLGTQPNRGSSGNEATPPEC